MLAVVLPVYAFSGAEITYLNPFSDTELLKTLAAKMYEDSPPLIEITTIGFLLNVFLNETS